jgi:hypothetical protein
MTMLPLTNDFFGRYHHFDHSSLLNIDTPPMSIIHDARQTISPEVPLIEPDPHLTHRDCCYVLCLLFPQPTPSDSNRSCSLFESGIFNHSGGYCYDFFPFLLSSIFAILSDNLILSLPDLISRLSYLAISYLSILSNCVILSCDLILSRHAVTTCQTCVQHAFPSIYTLLYL